MAANGKSIRVQLAAHELLRAATEGCRRYIEDRLKGLPDRRRAKNKDDWQIDIEGAMAEYAFAKGMDIEWKPAGMKQVDVANIQVKHTVLRNGCLLIKPWDPLEDMYVLVTGRLPVFMLRGWILGAKAKTVGTWRDPRGWGGAWYVTQAALRPMGEMVALQRRMKQGSLFE
jgi:hypothetical protein